MRQNISIWTETGKNNRSPFLDSLGYLKNTHKNSKFGRVRQVPTRELGWEFPGWDLSHFAKFGIFVGIISLNTLKYPILGICYFFLCEWFNTKQSLAYNWKLSKALVSCVIHEGDEISQNMAWIGPYKCVSADWLGNWAYIVSKERSSFKMIQLFSNGLFVPQEVAGLLYYLIWLY